MNAPQLIMAVWLGLLIGTSIGAAVKMRRPQLVPVDQRLLAIVAAGGTVEVLLLTWGRFWL